MKTPCRRSWLSHRSDPTSGASSRTIAFCCADWSVSNGVLRVVHSSAERGCVRLSQNRPSPDPFCRKSVVVREGGGGWGAPVAPITAVSGTDDAQHRTRSNGRALGYRASRSAWYSRAAATSGANHRGSWGFKAIPGTVGQLALWSLRPKG